MTRGDGRTTYADLLHLAARRVGTAAATLANERFSDAEAARAAVESYWGLLEAVHSHAWQLAGGTRRVEGIWASREPEPHDRAAARLIDTLAPAARHVMARDVPLARSGVGGAWESASQALGAASDLLATHRDHRGVYRSPDGAHLEDSSFRATAYAGLSDLCLTITMADRDLALRSGQAGVPWREVARRLPDVEAVAQEARALAAISSLTAAGAEGAIELTVARPKIRTADPLLELGDRILRLRANAWSLSGEAHVGIAALSEYAAAGVIVHTHVCAYLAEAGTKGSLSSAKSAVESAGRSRTAWANVHRGLRELRSATPGSAALRGDVSRIRDLCQTVFPLRRDAGGVHPADGGRGLNSFANGSLRSFTQIAGWNAKTLMAIADSGLVFAPGNVLSGADVSDDPRLVRAKLEGTLVRAPGQLLDRLAEAYRSAGTSVLLQAASPHGAPGGSPSVRDGLGIGV